MYPYPPISKLNIFKVQYLLFIDKNYKKKKKKICVKSSQWCFCIVEDNFNKLDFIINTWGGR